MIITKESPKLLSIMASALYQEHRGRFLYVPCLHKKSPFGDFMQSLHEIVLVDPRNEISNSLHRWMTDLQTIAAGELEAPVSADQSLGIESDVRSNLSSFGPTELEESVGGGATSS